MMALQAVWEKYTEHLRGIETLDSVSGLLAWDQQVNMPPAGAGLRARQGAEIAQIRHERMTDPRLWEWLAQLSEYELNPVQQASVRVVSRDVQRATRVSSALVQALSVAQAEGFQTWVQAKQASDFSMFAPALGRLLELVRESAAAIDSERPPYDVLLDQFDPGVTTERLKKTFSRLSTGLVELLGAVSEASPVDAFSGSFPVEAQRGLSDFIVAQFGYELNAGRLDISEHPFTVGLGHGDVRITTRLHEENLIAGLGATMHETGHALYEQGLPRETWAGTGLAAAVSLGMHESQSRFWENYVGRSYPFYQWLEPELQAHLGTNAPSAKELFRSGNRICPGLTRIYADEVTYNLHIIVRFELEVALLEGQLEVADLPAAWRQGYLETLGVEPQTDAEGVLQDVHWSHGMFGYFPSYTLGNLYAASFAAQLSEDMPEHMDRIRQGSFGEILGWLGEHIHQHGKRLESPQLLQSVVGDRDSVDDLLQHLWNRQGAMYGVQRN
jgi:carboxypeptidase Taq